MQKRKRGIEKTHPNEVKEYRWNNMSLDAEKSPSGTLLILLLKKSL